MKKIIIIPERKLPVFDWNILMGSVAFWNEEGESIYSGNIAKSLGSVRTQQFAQEEGIEKFILTNLAMDIHKSLPEGYTSGQSGSHIWVSDKNTNERVILIHFEK